jgi:hypothetical protein
MRSSSGPFILRVQGSGSDGRLQVCSRPGNDNNPQNYRMWEFGALTGTLGVPGVFVFRGWNDDNAAGDLMKITTVRTEYWRATDEAFIINNGSQDKDTIIKGDTDQELVYVEAAKDLVGIGRAPVNSKLEIGGNVETVGGAFGYVAEADDGARVLMKLVNVSPGVYAWDSGTVL